MIDTKELREAAEKTGTDGLYASNLVDIAYRAADELDRHVFFENVEQLETALEEFGFGKSNEFHIADLANYEKGVDYVYLSDSETVYITGIKPGNKRTLFQGKFNLLSRAVIGKIMEELK